MSSFEHFKYVLFCIGFISKKINKGWGDGTNAI